MKVVDDITAMRKLRESWRARGLSVSLAPTMGNLHVGHVSLVAKAKAHADRCVASIFVNPTQFGPGEDFDGYPRTLQEDLAKLQDVGCDAVFTPSVDAIYPDGPESRTQVRVPGLTDVLCGRSRPGHFDGVTTVVTILFNLVQPDAAVFGEKDFQQLQVLRRMVSDLHVPVAILGAPIVREDDGLALSSRNSYLTVDERAAAPQLHTTLLDLAARWASLSDSARDAALARARQVLITAGFEPDYLTVADENTLGAPHGEEAPLRLFAAARLGRARLIDNEPVARP